MIQNVVIGNPIVSPAQIFAADEADWEQTERKVTLFTDERFLPRILVQSGIVKSANEVRRNQPKLVRNLDEPDFIQVKWGKKFLWILVGE